ncbi:MAG: apolipoprotein N-acyltransferase [Thermodesulfobacteriota bacterium]
MTPPLARGAAAVLDARPRLAAAVAIAATALALARWSHVDRPGFVLGWVALAPWLLVLDRVQSLRTALLAGWAMSVAFVLAVFGWFAVAIHGYTGLPVALAYALLAVGAPLLEPQFLALAAVRHLARPGEHDPSGFFLRAAAAAGAYVGAEWAWPKLLGDTIGYGFFAAPLLVQAADAVGAPGLTFVLLLGNECLLRAGRDVLVRRRARHALAPLACVALLLGALLVYGTVRLRQLARRDAQPVAVAAIQAGYGQYARLAEELGTLGAVRTVLDAHFALSRDALARAPLALLVWPETVYPTTFGAPKSADGAALDREIATFVALSDVPLVFGAYDADGGEEFNAALLLERDAGGLASFDAYRKARLFPLTERVPELLDAAWVRRLLPWLGTWRPGESASVLQLGTARGRPLRIAPLICYDAVDPQLARAAVLAGAELLVTISNDAWFASGDGPRQHFVVSAFRGIETRTPQVRATTTGISAVLDATGRTVAVADVGERAALVASVAPRSGGSTLQLLWGDWFGAAGLGLAACLLPLARRRAASPSRPRRGGRSEPRLPSHRGR